MITTYIFASNLYMHSICSHINTPCDDCVVLLILVVVEVTADEIVVVWCNVIDIGTCFLTLAPMVVVAVELIVALAVTLTIMLLAILVVSVVVIGGMMGIGGVALNASKIPKHKYRKCTYVGL